MIAPSQVPRRRVRVLFLNDTARNGGPGRSLYYILKFLDPSVVHRAVVLPRPGVIAELYEAGQVAEEILFEPNLVENPIEPWSRAMTREDFDAALPTKGARLLGNLAKGSHAVYRLTRLLTQGRYDLVYCNGTNACFFGGALAKTARVPALWHVRYTSVPGALSGLHERLAASPGVARVVCVSRASASLFPRCPDKVVVIHNALDPEDFSVETAPLLRRELGLKEGTVVFGSHGRILPRKGYMEMIQAGKIALARMTATERSRCHFAVLGDTPEDIRPDHLAQCRAMVVELDLGPFFTFLGFRADVRPYIADYDVAVVPSVYPDPLPRSVIEAMAMSKPVIAFDVGGVSEMLADGETGALVHASPPDVNAMAEQFLRYFRDPGLRLRQGAAGRARIVREFSAATQATKIQDEILRAAGLT